MNLQSRGDPDDPNWVMRFSNGGFEKAMEDHLVESPGRPWKGRFLKGIESTWVGWLKRGTSQKYL
jgi:hypothetical protein